MQSTQNPTMPGSVRAARAIMCVQLLVTMLLNVVLFLPLAINGILLPNFFYGIGASALIGLLIIVMRTRRRWVRWAGGAVELALVANAIVGLSGGLSVGAFAGLALAVAVIALLLTSSSTAWFMGVR
ncbi:hypothetical protein ACTMTF_48135 [Nonomuraea sp. ZG12]|uniref:hypothetical protein n=1 Tax=Nonomuraea sp. ZG12 TaxID=3452207 RepID=UPI003F8AA369